VVSTKFWPCQKHDLLVGDFNAHAVSWDRELGKLGAKRGIEVKRGEMIEDWMIDKDMAALNDGRPTHVDRRTGRESAPDITIINPMESDKYDWEVLDKLGGSDHKPILITRRVDNLTKVNEKPKYKWDLANAKQVEFCQQVEDTLPPVHSAERGMNPPLYNLAPPFLGSPPSFGEPHPPAFAAFFCHHRCTKACDRCHKK
jgi:hypothetical protein